LAIPCGLAARYEEVTVGKFEWAAKVEEELGWYVYALRDPRNGSIFYIGKGKQNRVFQHAYYAETFSVPESQESVAVSQKIDLIQEIKSETGGQPDVLILRHKIPTEAAAYAVEAALLDFCRLLAKSTGEDFAGTGFSLTNLMGGWDSERLGLMTPEVLESIYAAEPVAKTDVTVPALLFKIPQLWTPDMSPNALYEATRGWWKLGAKRHQARFALAVSKGVIREIYTINPESWRNQREGDHGWNVVKNPEKRWGFEGIPFRGELEYLLNRDVKGWFKKGDQSAFTYINCG